VFEETLAPRAWSIEDGSKTTNAKAYVLSFRDREEMRLARWLGLGGWLMP
jgi:hypothetical protein